jgi:hypothetical protein
MVKPIHQPTLTTTMKSLDAMIREDRLAGVAGRGVSDKVLEAMIRTVPRALRREAAECIERLEMALEVTGFPQVTWPEALRRYRAVKAPGGIPAAAGLLPVVVLNTARELDRALARINAFEPEDYLSDPVVELAQSRRQRKAGVATGAKASAKAEVDRELRRPLIEGAILYLSRLKRVAPEKLTLSAVRGRLDRLTPKEPAVKLPGKTTLNGEIKAVLETMKKTDQSTG